MAEAHHLKLPAFERGGDGLQLGTLSGAGACPCGAYHRESYTRALLLPQPATPGLHCFGRKNVDIELQHSPIGLTDSCEPGLQSGVRNEAWRRQNTMVWRFCHRGCSQQLAAGSAGHGTPFCAHYSNMDVYIDPLLPLSGSELVPTTLEGVPGGGTWPGLHWFYSHKLLVVLWVTQRRRGWCRATRRERRKCWDEWRACGEAWRRWG